MEKNMRKTILIVEDVALNREMLRVLLGNEYNIIEASNGVEAVECIKNRGGDLSAILLDLLMPIMDGYGVLEYMTRRQLLDVVPVLVISAEASSDTERECLDMGVTDFIRKPFDGRIVRKRVGNSVELFDYKRQLEARVAMQTEALRRQNEILISQAEKLREMNDEIIDIMGTVVEYRNLESGEHIKRVKGFTRIIAEEMAERYPEYGLTKQRIDVITAASAMHDIGKIAIADSVLLKPGKLTREEFEYMKSHTTKGCEIIEQIKDVWDDEYKQTCYEICRYHHERDDGQGYPDGLSGDEIPIAAQIVSVADVYDALVSERVYKSAYDCDTAYEMILNGECGVFSDRLIECLKNTREKMAALAVEIGLSKD